MLHFNINSILKSWKWTVTQIVILVFGYGIGKFGFSFNWFVILITTNMRLLNMKNVREKSELSRIIQSQHTDEEILMAQLGNIPSWVKFPDYESSEWLNIIVKRVWPYFVEEFEGLLLRKLAEINFINGLKVMEFQFGKICPKFDGIKIYDQIENDLLIDFNVMYNGDAKFLVEFKMISAGIQNIEFHGNMRITLQDFLKSSRKPERMEFTFLSLPRVNFELLNALAPLDMFTSGDLIRTVLNEAIQSGLVHPNKISFEL